MESGETIFGYPVETLIWAYILIGAGWAVAIFLVTSIDFLRSADKPSDTFYSWDSLGTVIWHSAKAIYMWPLLLLVLIGVAGAAFAGAMRRAQAKHREKISGR